MAKRRKLTDRELLLVRRAKRDGFHTYRFGSARPVSLPRLFSDKKQTAMVHKVMDVLRDWRLSPFEHEGSARAGVRTALVMDGNGWAQSDFEAESLIGEALNLMGAKRPSEAEAAPEYTTPRENCANINCGGPLDAEAIANRDRFCCEECRTVTRMYRNARYWLEAEKTLKWAYAVAAKEAAPERACEWCGGPYRSPRPDTVTCCPEHASKLREQKAGRAIPDRPCKNPECPNTFHPQNRSVEYCCRECHRDHQIAMLGTDLCANPACGKLFDKRFAFEKFCCGKCRRAVEAARTLPEKPCAWCGEPFAPKKQSNEYCSRTHASRARVAKAKASRFTCDEVKEAA